MRKTGGWSAAKILILEMLAKIKKKDPSMYKPKVKFSDNNGDEIEEEKALKERKKPVYLKDVLAKQLGWKVVYVAQQKSQPHCPQGIVNDTFAIDKDDLLGGVLPKLPKISSHSSKSSGLEEGCHYPKCRVSRPIRNFLSLESGSMELPKSRMACPVSAIVSKICGQAPKNRLEEVPLLVLML
ncbi:hypothetical protein SELMODRAFT_404843 [Selaginella moellendorffii]|uniref:Uncharacterized protein n=1 Tax=Selaginella moellendorffii TaxID=88036 RepID=D8QXJ2_SELML|nr:hypothetical protein SELMODRAFT_404843 [Selaginella moellendorffii]